MLIEKAKALATIAHRGQLRKYTNEPYIVHPASVAKHLQILGMDEVTVAAAWLHDVIEDCEVTARMIELLVSLEVAQVVLEVSDISTKLDGNRKARKAKDVAHLSRSSVRGANIKLADLYDNTQSIVAHDPNFAVVYLREKKNTIDVLQHGDPRLIASALSNLVANQT